MKRFLILAAAVALYTVPARAQRDEGASMGVRLGVNLSVMDFTYADEKAMPGVSLGLFSKAPLTGGLSVQPELSGTMERVRVTVPGEVPDVDLTFYYAEFAVLAVYNINETFAVHAGPFIAYRVHMTHSESISPALKAGLFEKENFSVVNTGFIYGVAAELKRCDVGLRFNHGLYEIVKDTEKTGYPGVLGTRNSFLQLYFAYLF